MATLRHSAFLSFCALLATAALSLAQASSYKNTGAIKVGGNGSWDYLYADAAHRRLYVSHATEVDVFDIDSLKRVGKIDGLMRVHGIAIGPKAGFISDGGSNKVVQFNLSDLSKEKSIDAGQNPDGILYDKSSKRIFAFNGRSNDATAIDAAAGTVAGTIKLSGKPEFPASDGAGHVFVNIEDKNEIAKINAKTMSVESSWSLAPCDSPSGLAIDPSSRRLFSVCRNKMMAISSTESGKLVTTVPIGDGPDAAAFDPSTHTAFSSNGGSATLTVISAPNNGKFKVLGEVPTERGARTMTLDTKTHRVYLPTADFGSAPAATADNPHPRPSILPDSFRVLVLAPQ